MPYVDGYVLAVPNDRLEDYMKLAETAGYVWMEHGALSYTECVADDVPYGELTSFPRAVQAGKDETVIYGWITFDSREDRDEINRKVMADPRLKIPEGTTLPFDGKRMIYGGFKSIIDL